MPKLAALPVKILRNISSEYELPTNGLKADLVERLTAELGSDEISEIVLYAVLADANNAKMNERVNQMKAQLKELMNERREEADEEDIQSEVEEEVEETLAKEVIDSAEADNNDGDNDEDPNANVVDDDEEDKEEEQVVADNDTEGLLLSQQKASEQAAAAGKLPTRENDECDENDDGHGADTNSGWAQQIKPKISEQQGGGCFDSFEHQLRGADAEMLKEHYAGAIKLFNALTQKYANKAETVSDVLGHKRTNRCNECHCASVMFDRALERYHHELIKVQKKRFRSDEYIDDHQHME